MWKPARALRVRPADREWLEALGARRQDAAAGRAEGADRAGRGRRDTSNNGLAQELGHQPPDACCGGASGIVDAGVAGLLKDAPRPGAASGFGAEKVEAIVNATLHTTPRDATHWSVRSMAQAQRVSPATVHRIWQAANLQPHRTKTFKLSRDPHFVRKLRDVVGLYMNPPAKALVLSVDEKSQIQALDRTQPDPAVAAGAAGAADPRLHAPRHHHAVRRPQCPRRPCDRSVPAPPPARRVPRLPGQDRSGRRPAGARSISSWTTTARTSTRP